MSRLSSRRLTAAAAVAACVTAAAAPAVAQTVDVTLADSPGSRQFAVQDVSGNPLTAINLGSGGMQPFRTSVKDSAFKNLTAGYTVSAKMNNLYLQTAGGGTDFTTKVPSSDVSLQYGASPLSALGVSFPVLPRLSVSGVLQSCPDLDATTKTLLGLDSAGAVLDLTDTALVNLCSALLLADNLPAAATVDSAIQDVGSALTDPLTLAELPSALTGATPGAFTNPDFSDGTVGGGDPAKATAPAATSLGIMTGTPNMVAALRDVITNRVNAAIATLPVTSATEPAKTTIGALLTQLGASTDTRVADVATALGALDAARQSALLNTLSTVGLLTPELRDLVRLSGQYFGFPVLKATPSAPLAGTYKGTMTVTFVQG